MTKPDFWDIADEFHAELERAYKKHGVFAMSPLSLMDGFTALVEEVGEAGKALHERRITGKHGMREELVQLGSLCAAMIMKIDNGNRIGD